MPKKKNDLSQRLARGFPVIERLPFGCGPGMPGPYSINDSHRFIMASIPIKYEQNKCPAAFWCSRAVLFILVSRAAPAQSSSGAKAAVGSASTASRFSVSCASTL